MLHFMENPPDGGIRGKFRSKSLGLLGTMNINSKVNGNLAFSSQDTFTKASGFEPKSYIDRQLTDRP